MVVDASVAVKWHLSDEEDAEAAVELLTRFGEGDIELVAPDQIRYEVPNAIAVATIGQAPRLSQEQGREAIGEFVGLGLPTIADNELVTAAYPLVHQYGIAFYDALYLALALRLSIPLITADRRLYNRLRQLPGVIWIGDYLQDHESGQDHEGGATSRV
jgi:predicted nucleic acid-binding protein